MDAAASALLFPTFSRDFLPQWRPFGHIACGVNAVFRFLQATLETCSSSQFRASRFIALSLQTIRREITCNYNSSLVNILNCQDSSILRMCQHRSDILSAHTKHGGFGFIKFCKFTKSQKRNNLLFLTPYTIAQQKVNAVRYQNIDYLRRFRKDQSVSDDAEYFLQVACLYSQSEQPSKGGCHLPKTGENIYKRKDGRWKHALSAAGNRMDAQNTRPSMHAPMPQQKAKLEDRKRMIVSRLPGAAA